MGFKAPGDSVVHVGIRGAVASAKPQRTTERAFMFGGSQSRCHVQVSPRWVLPSASRPTAGRLLVKHCEVWWLAEVKSVRPRPSGPGCGVARHIFPLVRPCGCGSLGRARARADGVWT